MTIELKAVKIGYDKKTVLDNVELTIKSGHFYCVLGANGIGKTTLFKSILRFIPIQGGQLLIGGKKIETLETREISEYMSYVPQAKDNNYDMSVLDVVVMGRARFIRKFSQPKKNDYEKAFEVLEQFNIRGLAERRYAELSGGEQQVVLIARALAQESVFIIMDEPASNLDFENQKQVLKCMEGLAERGAGIVMASHSPDHALYCGSEVILIDKKRRVLAGGADEMLTTKNLRDIYGVDIRVIQEQLKDGQCLKACSLVH